MNIRPDIVTGYNRSKYIYDGTSKEDFRRIHRSVSCDLVENVAFYQIPECITTPEELDRYLCVICLGCKIWTN